jgi:hypothetical protein
MEIKNERFSNLKILKDGPPPAKTFGKNIKIKQEWEDLADVLAEVWGFSNESPSLPPEPLPIHDGPEEARSDSGSDDSVVSLNV